MLRNALILWTFLTLSFLATTSSALAATTSCGYDGYSYAGVTSKTSGSGISAGITALSAPKVSTGHIAAWVGVGGAGVGPNGTNEWLQAGISATPGQATSLYYELARPGADPQYRLVPLALRIGRTYEVAVQESPTRAGWWSVWVDGKQRTSGVYLPGSHGSWRPVATSESWDGGAPACNTYSFAFSHVLAKTAAGGWSPMGSSVIDAPGYTVTGRTLAGFTAVGGKV